VRLNPQLIKEKTTKVNRERRGGWIESESKELIQAERIFLMNQY